MAILVNGIPFTGSVGNIVCYRLKGTDKYVVRTKGGADRKTIKKKASCQPIRENASDFGSSGKAGGTIGWMLTYVKHLKDYNFMGQLNALSRNILAYDKENEKGFRQVAFSKYKHLLPGFSLNKKYPLDSIVRHPITCTINRKEGSVSIEIPELVPGLNLFLPWKSPMYRFILSVGVLTDGLSTKDLSQTDKLIKHVITGWRIATIQQPGEKFTLQLPNVPKLRENQTMLVAVGIEMGVHVTNELVSSVNYTGAAKILAAG